MCVQPFRKERGGEFLLQIENKILDKKLNWSDYLFLQNDVYKYKLEYEYSIFASYVGVRNINQQVVTILNKSNDGNIVNNLLSSLSHDRNNYNFQIILDTHYIL